MSRTGQIQKILSPAFSVKFVPANGDCFFKCISTCVADHTVKELRAMVADALTQETFDMMKMMWSAKQSGYEHMRKCEDLEGLKVLTLKSGAEEGYTVWAETFAIQIISNKLNLVVLILDEEVRGRDNPDRFIAIRPEAAEGGEGGDVGRDLKYILLQRTRRQHFNLIACSDSLIWDADTCPSRIRECWNLASEEVPGEAPAEVPEVEKEEGLEMQAAKRRKVADKVGWACSACTFFNKSNDFLCCEVCGEKKPEEMG
ncbi:hypothetical protein TrVE_jg13932 [Triparma verrucosa]|uniref:OTU domain-containing protein n=1 Tax=Triparma verrucosa TaxID=1606542 RepID=A0A9W7EK26_9STRA|nr:hypothetical protein TrVE_jg13932 [Triparma verrucosa]